MQTRKRAKSVMFGKKDKDKREKDETVKETEEKELSTAPEETHEKTKDEKKEEKTESSELSATPPKTEEEPEEEKKESEVATPSSEFISDGALSSTPEQPKSSSETPAVTPEEPQAASSELSETPKSEETPQPTEVTPPTSTTGQPIQPTESAPAQSAFTIQPSSTESASTTVVEGEKKRFGFYFIVVALIAFVLGLGAMAALSYFGVVNMRIPGFSSKFQLPILGAKPTLTPPPQPTVAPTAKPVDLTAFTISVLNGSGVSGKAAEVKTTLTTAGFKVVSTGNADNNNFAKTQIAAKKTVNPTFLSKLQDELSKSYTVDPTIASLTSGSSDVVVTIGSQTAK